MPVLITRALGKSKLASPYHHHLDKVQNPKLITMSLRGPHPLEELSPKEIETAAAAVRRNFNDQFVRFKFIVLVEPPKHLLVPYLDAERSKNKDASSSLKPPRVAKFLCSVGLKTQLTWHDGIYEFDKQKLVASKLPDDLKAPGDPEEASQLGRDALNNPKFIKALDKYKLPANVIIETDPWGFGCDTKEPTERLKIVYGYYRNPANNDPDSNMYAHPLPIAAVVHTATHEVIDIIECATGGTQDGLNRDTIDKNEPTAHVTGCEYVPELVDEPVRKDLKPIRITQPEGASFKVEGNRVYWQKWSFIVGFNYREALTIHDVHYDGRSLFHRLSLSEMNVPYGDPRTPYHRKQAFDAGDVGLGFTANELNLGCDCLGLIKYFDAVLPWMDGTSRKRKNVICMHEQDEGLVHKHTNYRTGRPVVARNRHLILQTICTVNNYEYLWIWKFDLAGAVTFEVRATGILSTAYIDKGKTSPWGNVVAPGVLGQNHQHIFALRIDPAVDGHKNTLVYDDQIPLSLDDPENPYGTAWKAHRTILDKSGHADYNPLAARVFKIINENSINPISQNPVAYGFHPHHGAMQLAHPESISNIRGEYGQHPIWVTQYRDDELFAGGFYTNQSNGNAKGMSAFVARNDNVRNDDIVVWHSFSLTHSPRVEDFPIMPVEKVEIMLKPLDFFTKNPALDVPQATQKFNSSELYEDEPCHNCHPKL